MTRKIEPNVDKQTNSNFKVSQYKSYPLAFQRRRKDDIGTQQSETKSLYGDSDVSYNVGQMMRASVLPTTKTEPEKSPIEIEKEKKLNQIKYDAIKSLIEEKPDLKEEDVKLISDSLVINPDKFDEDLLKTAGYSNQEIEDEKEAYTSNSNVELLKYLSTQPDLMPEDINTILKDFRDNDIGTVGFLMSVPNLKIPEYKKLQTMVSYNKNINGGVSDETIDKRREILSK